jgi:hypothetical protein
VSACRLVRPSGSLVYRRRRPGRPRRTHRDVASRQPAQCMTLSRSLRSRYDALRPFPRTRRTFPSPLALARRGQRFERSLAPLPAPMTSPCVGLMPRALPGRSGRTQGGFPGMPHALRRRFAGASRIAPPLRPGVTRAELGSAVLAPCGPHPTVTRRDGRPCLRDKHSQVRSAFSGP